MKNINEIAADLLDGIIDIRQNTSHANMVDYMRGMEDGIRILQKKLLDQKDD